MREPKGVRNVNNGVQLLYEFKNGYGASVIKSPFSFGSSKGLWELAVLHNDAICYDTPITSDVVGHLSDDEVDELLDKIEALPAKMELLTESSEVL